LWSKKTRLDLGLVNLLAIKSLTLTLKKSDINNIGLRLDVKHLHFINFLDSLSLGNDPKYIKLNERVRNHLAGVEIEAGQYNPNTEQLEKFLEGPTESIQPFVFSLFDPLGIENVVPDDELSLPFRATWVEMFDQPLVRQIIHGQIEVDETGSISVRPNFDEELSVLHVIKGKKVRAKISQDMVGALIIEPDNPKEAYRAVMHLEMRLLSVHPDDQGDKLFEKVKQKSGDRAIFRENYAGMLYHTMAHDSYSAAGLEGKLYRAAQFLFTSMRKGSSETGTVRVDARAKVGTGVNRRLMKIKNLVIVAPKKEKNTLAEHIGAQREIDWSHRWDVMGHWRKVTGIGKDRAGNYAIKGYTWVISHTKGPEDKVLVRKTRFVPGDE
jgi:hypothetical protein